MTDAQCNDAQATEVIQWRRILKQVLQLPRPSSLVTLCEVVRGQLPAMRRLTRTASLHAKRHARGRGCATHALKQATKAQ